MSKLPYIIAYLLLCCLLGFLLMGLDKWKAKRRRFRISEQMLFFVALVGGAAGATLGMHVFHHKTKHWYFRYGLPAIFILQLAGLAAYVCWDIFFRA